MTEPAASLIVKLGGPREIARAIRIYAITDDSDRRIREIAPSTVSRWTRPIESGGTGGTVPLKYWPALIKYARARGLTLTIHDLNTRAAIALEQSQ